jgi:hypothetical protein
VWWPKKKPSPAEMIREMRRQVLSVIPAALGLAPSPGLRRVWAILMETGYDAAVASLVVIADGSTSLYFSNGGGMIGCGEHESVRAAGTKLLAAAEVHLGLLSPVADMPLPEVGRVRFYVRTFDGIVGAEAAEVDLGENRSQLSPLFVAGHEVITAIRLVQQPRGSGLGATTCRLP